MMFKIREAFLSDIRSIAAIHTAQSRSQTPDLQGGFLLTESSETIVQDSIEKGTRYFVAIADSLSVNQSDKNQSELVGFVAISQPKISAEMLQHIQWLKEDYSDRLLSDRHYYIQVLATKPGWTGKGVARSLYAFLNQEFSPAIFSAFLVTQPITNHRSLHFHLQQGFIPIGVIQYDQFLDMKNYECYLVYRQN